ncbi:MAG: RtcB family protein [Bacteroidales bacterium]|nr:RtcB family protein [Bacteroidales bacterium]
MEVMLINGKPVKIWSNEVDGHAMKEIENLASLPFVFHHLAFMPDVHGGMGMPIGGVLAAKDVVVPNAVGVDIGCGMCAVKTNLEAKEMTPTIIRKSIMSSIRELIPLGFDHHPKPQSEELMPEGFDIDNLTVVKQQYESARRQLGTLGGGNHFIELQKDSDGYLWIMVHSGSRNLGAKVGKHYNDLAKKLNEQWYSSVDPSILLSFLPMGSNEFKAYWKEMEYCIQFAFCNRKLMMSWICDVIAGVFPNITFEPMINIAHNYATFENHFGKNVIVHRKGATRAREGEIGIIPGSQGTNSYIVEGLGNPDSFQSCSHGAGRKMSRTQAVKTLSLADEIKKLDDKGIIHAIRRQTDLEEAASAYKDIGVVMANQADLVKIKVELSPIAVIKG